MSETKKTGALKYKNKQKYKNKAKVIPKAKETSDSVDDDDKIVIDDDYPYRRRGLESNWHRYEIKDEVAEEVDVAKDFSAIVSAPVTQGNYFQFKGDKNLDNYEEEQVESEIFKLDMKLLSLSFLCIPFHTRCNIDEKYFSENDLNVSNANSVKAREQYERALEELEEKKLKEEIADVEVGIDNVGEDNLGSLLLKNDCTGSQKQTTIDSNDSVDVEKENLEKWLDDILDD